MTFGKNIVTALKGFAMGAGNVIPGCSAGTIALLTGVFTPVIDSLDAVASKETWKALFKGNIKEFWKRINGTFLLWLLGGAVISVLILAKLVTWALAHYPVQAWAFSFGLIAASTYFLLVPIKNWKLKDYCLLAVGVAFGVAFSLLSPTKTPDTDLLVFLTGAIGVCAMILPGLSGSLVLVLMGKYETIMSALDVADLNWRVLIVFGLGCLIGLVAFSKFLHWLLEKHERETLIVMIGFVLGALVKVWPWLHMDEITAANALAGTPGAMHIGAAVAFCAIGSAIVILLEILAHKKK